MAISESDSASPSLFADPPLSPSKKENLTLTKSRLDELIESRSEISNRIQSMKQDLQNWRAKLETQVKSHREELTGLRKSLEVEVTQLKSEFQELRTTLQQQQEDVTISLKNLGWKRDGGLNLCCEVDYCLVPGATAQLQDPPTNVQTASALQVDDDSTSIEARRLETSPDKSSAEDSITGEHDAEVLVSST